MRQRVKVGRNDVCPCGSGHKFKNCCEGKVDWNGILRSDQTRAIEYLSIRGRNLIFSERILEALKFDNDTPPKSLLDFKKAFTPDAVRLINEAIVELWPKRLDIHSVLSASKVDVSGLYVGEYQPDHLFRAVKRHCLYANKILLVDPFIHPLSMREEYSPLTYPEQYRTQTLRNVHIWFQFLPWIQAGLVEFIRTPADFDHKLNWESMLRQKKKFEESPELRAVFDATMPAAVEDFTAKEGFRMMVLSAPDDYLLRLFNKLGLATNEFGEKEFLEYINNLRKKDPFFLEPFAEHKATPEYHYMSSGASYDMARLTAGITGSYLVTDLETKWKEIELDRKQAGISQSEWSPLAKAFQNANLKYLNALDLPHALAVRQEGRLASLRTFLRRVWSVAATGNPFAEQNAQHLADELDAEVRSTEEEWKQIDRDLIKWLGGEAAATLLSTGPLIASGHAGFVAAAALVAGTATLTTSYLQRRGFQDKYPAAFFMKLSKRAKK